MESDRCRDGKLAILTQPFVTDEVFVHVGGAFRGNQCVPTTDTGSAITQFVYGRRGTHNDLTCFGCRLFSFGASHYDDMRCATLFGVATHHLDENSGGRGTPAKIGTTPIRTSST